MCDGMSRHVTACRGMWWNYSCMRLRLALRAFSGAGARAGPASKQLFSIPKKCRYVPTSHHTTILTLEKEKCFPVPHKQWQDRCLKLKVHFRFGGCREFLTNIHLSQYLTPYLGGQKVIVYPSLYIRSTLPSGCMSNRPPSKALSTRGAGPFLLFWDWTSWAQMNKKHKKVSKNKNKTKTYLASFGAFRFEASAV